MGRISSMGRISNVAPARISKFPNIANENKSESDEPVIAQIQGRE